MDLVGCICHATTFRIRYIRRISDVRHSLPLFRSLFVYFSISIRAIQISLRTLLERVDSPNRFLLLSSFVFFSLETFNRSENLYAFSRYRKIYGCFSNKVLEIESRTAQRIARWLISLLASSLTHSLARSFAHNSFTQADSTRKSCIHRKRNHQPIWLFMYTHTILLYNVQIRS